MTTETATDERRGTSRDELLQRVVDHLCGTCVDSQSLRGIAAAVGTSHRMLIYHFGSREGLLAEVVTAVERLQREAFAVVTTAEPTDPREVAEAFWRKVVGPSVRYGPLFFELSAHAMQGRPHAASLAANLVEPWLEVVSAELTRGGMEPDQARRQARLGLAVVRGLLLDLLVTGERSDIDAAYELFLDLVLPSGPRA